MLTYVVKIKSSETQIWTSDITETEQMLILILLAKTKTEPVFKPDAPYFTFPGRLGYKLYLNQVGRLEYFLLYVSARGSFPNRRLFRNRHMAPGDGWISVWKKQWKFLIFWMLWIDYLTLSQMFHWRFREKKRDSVKTKDHCEFDLSSFAFRDTYGEKKHTRT